MGLAVVVIRISRLRSSRIYGLRLAVVINRISRLRSIYINDIDLNIVSVSACGLRSNRPLFNLTANLAEDTSGAEERAEAVIANIALDAVLGTDTASLIHNKAAREAAEEVEDCGADTAAPVLNLLGVVTVLNARKPAHHAA